MSANLYQAKEKDAVLNLLKQANLHPTTFAINDDNSFVASFDSTPIPTLEAQIETIDENLVILEPEALPEVRQPNQDAGLASVVRFAFIN